MTISRDEIMERLRADKETLDAFGVGSVAVFGSCARGDARVDSDVDLLVHYRPDVRPDLFDLIDLQIICNVCLADRSIWSRRRLCPVRYARAFSPRLCMPERDWHIRVNDIAVAIDKIERYTADMTLADFQPLSVACRS